MISQAKEILALDKGSWAIMLPQVFLYAVAFHPDDFPAHEHVAGDCSSPLQNLSYRNEVTAIWAAGISARHLIIMLLPLGLSDGRSQLSLE